MNHIESQKDIKRQLIGLEQRRKAFELTSEFFDYLKQHGLTTDKDTDKLAFHSLSDNRAGKKDVATLHVSLEGSGADFVKFYRDLIERDLPELQVPPTCHWTDDTFSSNYPACTRWPETDGYYSATGVEPFQAVVVECSHALQMQLSGWVVYKGTPIKLIVKDRPRHTGPLSFEQYTEGQGLSERKKYRTRHSQLMDRKMHYQIMFQRGNAQDGVREYTAVIDMADANKLLDVLEQQ